MVDDADGAVECDYERYDEEGQSDYADGLSPGKALCGLGNIRRGRVGNNHVPIAMILEANCHVAALSWCQFEQCLTATGGQSYLKASDIQ